MVAKHERGRQLVQLVNGRRARNISVRLGNFTLRGKHTFVLQRLAGGFGRRGVSGVESFNGDQERSEFLLSHAALRGL